MSVFKAVIIIDVHLKIDPNVRILKIIYHNFQLKNLNCV